MMTEQKSEGELFQGFLSTLYSLKNPLDPLKILRDKAWDHFLKLGLPSRKNDLYRYVRLHHFYSKEYTAADNLNEIKQDFVAPYILKECEESVIVFINGHFSSSLSRLEGISKKVVISSLKDAMSTYSGFINKVFAKNLKEEKDPFAAINMALHQEGVFIYFPPNTVIDTPLQLLNIIHTNNEPMVIMPRVQIYFGKQSQGSLISTQSSISSEYYTFNGVTDISQDEDSHVHYTQIADNINRSTWNFESLRASLKSNSTLKTVNITKGSATTRFDYRVTLLSENSEVSLNGLSKLSEKNESHTHVLIEHQAPNCRSNQLFKSLLQDASHSSFEGKILVQKTAHKTEAFQLNKHLLLSDQAFAESKPNLEIFASDVKASHGATFGQLDKEELFYMKSRGLTQKEAEEILIKGFCQEIISLLPLFYVNEEIGK